MNAEQKQIIKIAREIQIRAKDQKFGNTAVHLSTPYSHVELQSANAQIQLETHFNNISLAHTTLMMYRLAERFGQLKTISLS